jgi:hypothetical protein
MIQQTEIRKQDEDEILYVRFKEWMVNRVKCSGSKAPPLPTVFNEVALVPLVTLQQKEWKLESRLREQKWEAADMLIKIYGCRQKETEW